MKSKDHQALQRRRRINLDMLLEERGAKADLARRLGVTSPVISHLISGSRDMGEKMARDIEEALGLDENALDRYA